MVEIDWNLKLEEALIEGGLGECFGQVSGNEEDNQFCLF